jgi:hypothetical protein
MTAGPGLGRKKFQGDEAPEFGVLGFVDPTHAAAAKLLDDAVVRDGLADQDLTDQI